MTFNRHEQVINTAPPATMAEAFPEFVTDIGADDCEESLAKPISILLLATKWQFDTYGLSTVNLRLVNPEGGKIQTTCAVVEVEGHVTEDERKDAEKYKVKIIGAKQPRGRKKRPDVEWLDENTAAYYPALVKQNSYDYIIGHAPYLANGPLNIRDFYSEAECKPTVLLMIHELPKTAEGDTDDDVLLEWLSEADVIFSVGKEVEAEIDSSITSLLPEQRPTHKLYIPSFPLELFNVWRRPSDRQSVHGTQNVTLITGGRGEVNGLDFPLAVASTYKSSKHILDFDGLKTNFVLLTNNKEDKEEWKKEFSEILEREGSKGRSLNFQSDGPETLEKLKTHLRKSNLFILPLKPDSPLFGTEALSAIAAGVPILVSSHSGIVSILKVITQDNSLSTSN